MSNYESVNKMAENLIAAKDPAIALAEVCVQSYATLRQVAPDIADETMCSLGGARNPFVSMIQQVAQVTDSNSARVALCLVMTRKGLKNPHEHDLKTASKRLSMSAYAGLADACAIYPRETFGEAVQRISGLCKQAGIKIGEVVGATGVPRNTIYAWSAGTRTPRAIKQERYCEATANLLHAKAVKR